MERKMFEKKDRGFHEVFYNHDKGWVLVSWADTKRVLLASDFVGVEPLEGCERWCKKTKKQLTVSQPAIVRAYNHFMGGVDLADMLAALHECPFRWQKWFLRIFVRMIDTALSNAWLVYRANILVRKINKFISQHLNYDTC